jgi:sulfur carrier protein ThiS adenylyltransferase
MMEKNRYERQSDIFNGSGLSVTIVGVGAVGRQVAIQLATMGVQFLHLVDFDKVEAENLGAQGFRECDLGRPKVHAVGQVLGQINSEIEVTVSDNAYTPMDIDGADYVCCCVDTMAVRQEVFADCRVTKKGFFDSRMSAEVCTILTVDDAKSAKWYDETLFGDDERLQEACTSKTTFYCASICAGLLVSQLVAVNRGNERQVYHDITLDIGQSGLLRRTGGDTSPAPVNEPEQPRNRLYL